MKIYKGKRTPTGGRVTVTDGKVTKILPLYLDWRNHSPTGHEWGYGGSGPAQLALAILADYTQDKERTLDAYQLFKRDVITGLSDEWTLTGEEIEKALRSIELRDAS